MSCFARQWQHWRAFIRKRAAGIGVDVSDHAVCVKPLRAVGFDCVTMIHCWNSVGFEGNLSANADWKAGGSELVAERPSRAAEERAGPELSISSTTFERWACPYPFCGDAIASTPRESAPLSQPQAHIPPSLLRSLVSGSVPCIGLHLAHTMLDPCGPRVTHKEDRKKPSITLRPFAPTTAAARNVRYEMRKWSEAASREAHARKICDDEVFVFERVRMRVSTRKMTSFCDH